MAKVYMGDKPKKINAVFKGKIIQNVVFDDDGIFKTDNARIIKILSDFGYELDNQAKKILAEAEKEGFPEDKLEPDLKLENEKLKKEIEDLKSENDKLKLEIEDLKKDKGKLE